MILVVDNYDSFVFNLARHFALLGQATEVVRNDQLDIAAIGAAPPAAIVLSPGPCGPAEAGRSLELLRSLDPRVPVLGVCLGHQTLVAALGGEIVRAPAPVHGRASTIRHRGDGLFASLPSRLAVGRYHSLVARRDTLPAALEVTAETDDGLIMAVAHLAAPWFGVQFHPESILTEGGVVLLGNFLHVAGISAEGAQ